jgi:peptidylprolyl isomerase
MKSISLTSRLFCLFVSAVLIVASGCAGAGQDKVVKLPEENGLVVKTTKGSFTIELYRTFSHRATMAMLGSVKLGWYNGVQFFKPIKVRSNDITLYEVLPLRISDTEKDNSRLYEDLARVPSFRRGAVGMIRMPNKRKMINSRYGFFICREVMPGANVLNGQFTIVGVVVEGMDVVDKLEESDVIESVTALKIENRNDNVGAVNRLTSKK